MNAEFPRIEQPDNANQPGLNEADLEEIRLGNDGNPHVGGTDTPSVDLPPTGIVRPVESWAVKPDHRQLQQFEDDGGPPMNGIC